MSHSIGSTFDDLSVADQIRVDEQLIALDQIRQLPYIAREKTNEDYEKLYQSIKTTGLQQPFIVARPPDSEHYVLIAGGNTRLEIVQRLHQESRGSQFHEVRCLVTFWPGTCAAKVRHLVTNSVLLSTSFMERAEAILNFIDENPDLPIDRNTSDRGVSKFFLEHGYPLYRTTYAAMRYAVDFLNEYLPLSLVSTLSTLDVKHIQRLENDLKRDWIVAGKEETEFNQLFAEIARSCDHEDLDFETFRSVLTEQIAEELQVVSQDSGDRTAQCVPIEDELNTKPVRQEYGVQPEFDTAPTSLVTSSNEPRAVYDLLNDGNDLEPPDQIRSLAFELAQRFKIQDCVSLNDLGEFGFLVVELPSDEAPRTTVLIWEYLANFSGTCELSKEDLIPHVSNGSKLYNEFQESGSSLSLETAKDLDLSLMWILDSESFELVIQLWRLVFEHTEFRPDLEEIKPPNEPDQHACVAA